jgi:hypothetical protein
MAAFSPKTIAARREPSGNDAQIKNRWARAQAANVAASFCGPRPAPNLRALRVFVVRPVRQFHARNSQISPFRELPCHSVANPRGTRNRWARAQPANMAAFSPKTIAARREPSGNDAQIKNRWARAQAANVAASIRGPRLGPNLRALRVFVVNPTRAKALISPFRELPCHSVAKPPRYPEPVGSRPSRQHGRIFPENNSGTARVVR